MHRRLAISVLVLAVLTIMSVPAAIYGVSDASIASPHQLAEPTELCGQVELVGDPGDGLISIGGTELDVSSSWGIFHLAWISRTLTCVLVEWSGEDNAQLIGWDIGVEVCGRSVVTNRVLFESDGRTIDWDAWTLFSEAWRGELEFANLGLIGATVFTSAFGGHPALCLEIRQSPDGSEGVITTTQCAQVGSMDENVVHLYPDLVLGPHFGGIKFSADRGTLIIDERLEAHTTTGLAITTRFWLEGGFEQRKSTLQVL
jgi:hypothetical protein